MMNTNMSFKAFVATASLGCKVEALTLLAKEKTGTEPGQTAQKFLREFEEKQKNWDDLQVLTDQLQDTAKVAAGAFQKTQVRVQKVKVTDPLRRKIQKKQWKPVDRLALEAAAQEEDFRALNKQWREKKKLQEQKERERLEQIEAEKKRVIEHTKLDFLALFFAAVFFSIVAWGVLELTDLSWLTLKVVLFIWISTFVLGGCRFINVVHSPVFWQK